MRHNFSLALIVPLAAFALSGCATESGTTSSLEGTYRTTTTTTPISVTSTTVTYADGSYNLYDSATGPYWVWVPKGVTIGPIPTLPPIPLQTAVVVQPVAPAPAQTVVVQPAPPAPAQTAVVVQPAAPMRTVVAAANGQFMLYGDGSTSAPYYWVWIPAGTTPPSPPPRPR